MTYFAITFAVWLASCQLKNSKKMTNSTESTGKFQKNTLNEYYDGLPEGDRLVFRHQVVLKLGINESTLYRWLRGENRPRKTEAIILAEICGIPANKLYPHHFLLDNIKNQ